MLATAFLTSIIVPMSSGGGGQISTAVLETDPVAGVGFVARIDNLVVNDSGSWIVETDTDHANTDADSVLIKNGALLLREDQALPLPSGARLDSFDALTLNANDESAYNFFLDGTVNTNDDSGVYFGTKLVIQEGDLSTASDFSAGTVYRGFFEVKLNASNRVLIMASVDDPVIPSTVDRALVFADLDASGNLLGEKVLSKEGDILPGQTEAVADFQTGPHDFAMNAGGDVVFIADLTGSTASDGAVYLNGTLLAQEGQASPVPGRLWSALGSSARVDLDDAGGWVLIGQLDGSTVDDRIIVKNGAKVVQEGDNLPAIGAFTLTSLDTSSPVFLGNDGSVLWYGQWDDPNTTRDEGLFLDDQLIVQEGVTQVGAVTLASLASTTDSFHMSPSGRFVIFEGTLANGLEGAFLIDCGTPTVYCTSKSGLACGPAGIAFSGTSSASASAGFTISAFPARSGKLGVLLYSNAGRANLPFPLGGHILCIQTPIRRGGPVDSGGTPGPFCDGAFSLDMNSFASGTYSPPFPTYNPAAYLLAPGQQVNVQWWGRDSVATGSYMTDALEYVVGL